MKEQKIEDLNDIKQKIEELEDIINSNTDDEFIANKTFDILDEIKNIMKGLEE